MLLGRYIGFTLDLSGIAGFIVAIGGLSESSARAQHPGSTLVDTTAAIRCRASTNGGDP